MFYTWVKHIESQQSKPSVSPTAMKERDLERGRLATVEESDEEEQDVLFDAEKKDELNRSG